jgi:hypothetical protein
MLHGREQEPPALHLLVAALEIDALAREQPPEDRKELGRVRIALVMRQEDAVARKLLRIAPGDEVDEEAAVADAVECGGLTRPMGRCGEAGRSAARNFRRSVWGASAAAVIQGSSQCEPTGIRTPPKPSWSAAWAICLR